jgi:hypothetical protein
MVMWKFQMAGPCRSFLRAHGVHLAKSAVEQRGESDKFSFNKK